MLLVVSSYKYKTRESKSPSTVRVPEMGLTYIVTEVTHGSNSGPQPANKNMRDVINQ